ncbi:unnamed protein product, partial [marine sediment metagenome]
KKGDADLLEEKRKGIEMQLTAANNRAKTQIDEFKAQTDRMEAQIKAKEAGLTIEMKRIEQLGPIFEYTSNSELLRS